MPLTAPYVVDGNTRPILSEAEVISELVCAPHHHKEVFAGRLFERARHAYAPGRQDRLGTGDLHLGGHLTHGVTDRYRARYREGSAAACGGPPSSFMDFMPWPLGAGLSR